MINPLTTDAIVSETKMVMDSLSHERADELENVFFASAAERLDFQQKLLMIARRMESMGQTDSFESCLKVMGIVSAISVFERQQNLEP